MGLRPLGWPSIQEARFNVAQEYFHGETFRGYGNKRAEPATSAPRFDTHFKRHHSSDLDPPYQRPVSAAVGESLADGIFSPGVSEAFVTQPIAASIGCKDSGGSSDKPMAHSRDLALFGMADFLAAH